ECETYEELWRWSVTHLDELWETVWRHFGVVAHEPYRTVLARRDMPGAVWFPGARLNYAEMALGARGALVSVSQTRDRVALDPDALVDQVARARVGLQSLGVGPGDRVVAYLPNI